MISQDFVPKQTNLNLICDQLLGESAKKKVLEPKKALEKQSI